MKGELVQIGEHRAKPPASSGSGPVRLVATLTFAALFSGLAIVGAYELTLPTIAANQAAALRQAVFEVVPGAEKLQRLAWNGDRLEPAEGDSGTEPSIYAAHAADGKFLGYAIPAEGAGYQDTIRLIYGFDPGRRRVVGMQVLESRETPGLGDRIYKDQGFVAAFRDLAIEPVIELVKDGASAPTRSTG
ncbi:MAG: FMN-binding protein [Thermoanaerobaculia bacterium]|nr:FMN-binding protein [Thermoanaerobaculia bacterium]